VYRQQNAAKLETVSTLPANPSTSST
jgi:hypothetical protein